MAAGLDVDYLTLAVGSFASWVGEPGLARSTARACERSPATVVGVTGLVVAATGVELARRRPRASS
jgi:hypothetical protein